MSPATDPAAEALDLWSTLPLSPQHAAMLQASAISPEVAGRRGYRTVTSKAEVAAAGFAPSQRRVPTLLVPVCDVTGEVVLHQHRPDRPRLRNGKALKYETPAGARMAVDVPPALARIALNDPAVPLIVTEGVKKADAAVSAGLACIALLGVWNWRGKNAQGGVAALADWDSIALNGRLVYVCFDSDVTTKREVRAALKRLRAFLVQRKARVRVVYLPPTADGGKQGLDDFLAAGGTVEQIEALAENDVREEPDDASDDRPEIVITTDEHDVADAAVAALVREPGLYHRAGKLVRVRVDRRASAAPVIECMPLATIRELLTKNARLVRMKARSIDGARCLVKERTHPPDFLVRAVDARGEWAGTRYLVGVTEHPSLRPDGSMLEAPGHDEATGLLYVPSLNFPNVPALPTRDDAVSAAKLVVSGQVVYERSRVTRVDVYATALLFDDGVTTGSGSVTTSGVGRSSVSTVR